MKKYDKQRLINIVLGKNPNCTECGTLMVNHKFEYEPKKYPLDMPTVSKRADNGKNWVMCKACSINQSVIRNEKIKKEAELMIDKNSIQKVSVKTMTDDELNKVIIKQNIAINLLLGQYGVPKDVISEVRSTIRSQFHINYYRKTGKFLTEHE